MRKSSLSNREENRKRQGVTKITIMDAEGNPVTKSVADWAKYAGISRQAMYNRLSKAQTEEQKQAAVATTGSIQGRRTDKTPLA